MAKLRTGGHAGERHEDIPWRIHLPLTLQLQIDATSLTTGIRTGLTHHRRKAIPQEPNTIPPLFDHLRTTLHQPTDMAQPLINRLPDQLLLQILDLVMAPAPSREIEIEIEVWNRFSNNLLMAPWRTPLTRTCQRWRNLACDLTINKNTSLTIRAPSYPAPCIEKLAKIQKSARNCCTISLLTSENGARTSGVPITQLFTI